MFMPFWTLIFPIAGISMLIIRIAENRKVDRPNCTPFVFQFSVPNYIERMDKLACELSEESEFFPVELWWGCDGWRQKPDGTFQRVTRWKPEAITSNPYHISLALQSANSDIQKLNQQLFRFQVQNMMMQQNQSFINSMCNYSVPMPDYIRNSYINSYVPDLTRCCCDFHSRF